MIRLNLINTTIQNVEDYKDQIHNLFLFFDRKLCRDKTTAWKNLDSMLKDPQDYG